MSSGERVLVIDFGGQYTHLIARRCRELGVYSEIVSNDVAAADIEAMGDVKGIILSGGPRSVYQENAPMMDQGILKLGIPILGICYGHQLIAKLMGGQVERSEKAEYGRVSIKIDSQSRLFDGLPNALKVWMSHGDVVKTPPPSFKITSETDNGLISSLENDQLMIYTTQFHPEVKHTDNGMMILENFLRKIAGFREYWRPMDRIEEMIKEIHSMVGPGDKVVCGVSGGIDSITTATILNKAIGNRLHVVFIDHGLLRKGEVEEVLNTLKSLNIQNIHFIDASNLFLSKLRGVSDPEEKRRIIGELFITVFEEEAQKISGVKFLAQGTIYPDRVESGATGRSTDLIKSHHNVAGLPSGLRLVLIEPLKDLYKDEVREVAAKLGVPRRIIERHPFPGPGLAVRIIGEVTPEKLSICREANAILEEEIRRANIYNELWQAFVVVTDSKWVGVKGDARKEGYIVIIRIVTSEDAMTADWYPISPELLDRISRRITNEIEEVVMVTYAVSSKPPATIEPC
jgi:GMP synthase (glutamine-hydrolysing)